MPPADAIAAPAPRDMVAEFADCSARQVMARHAKTFFWASRLMPRQIRRDIETLYGFCRFVDDVADETPDVAQRRRLLDRIAADLVAGRSEFPLVAGFIDLARRRGIEIDCARELIVGAAGDVEGVRIATRDELLRYGYRVASTVGLMVCGVLGVNDRNALAYAIDLGIAMQLTNIARDVVEDHGNGRIYLPADLIPHETILRAFDYPDAAARARVLSAVYELLNVADAYYRSAEHGLCHLPRLARWAILTAAGAYEAIGTLIHRRGVGYWDGRVYTSKALKLRHTWTAGWRILREPVLRDVRLCPPHNPRLHAALAGLPYADAPAAPRLHRAAVGG